MGETGRSMPSPYRKGDEKSALSQQQVKSGGYRMDSKPLIEQITVLD